MDFHGFPSCLGKPGCRSQPPLQVLCMPTRICLRNFCRSFELYTFCNPDADLVCLSAIEGRRMTIHFWETVRFRHSRRFRKGFFSASRLLWSIKFVPWIAKVRGSRRQVASLRRHTTCFGGNRFVLTENCAIQMRHSMRSVSLIKRRF